MYASIMTFVQLTFEHMPSGQKPAEYVRLEQRPFDFDDQVDIHVRTCINQLFEF